MRKWRVPWIGASPLLLAAVGVVAVIASSSDSPAVGRVPYQTIGSTFGADITPGRSTFLAIAKHDDRRGFTVTRFRSEGDALVLEAPDRVRVSRLVGHTEAMELPNGDWLVAANRCEDEDDDICTSAPTSMHRVRADGGLEHVADLDVGSLTFVGHADPERAVISYHRQIVEPVLRYEGPFFRTLDIRTGAVTDIATPPMPGPDGPPTDLDHPAQRFGCAAAGRLWLLDGYYDPGGTVVSAFSSVDLATGTITPPAIVQPVEQLKPFRPLCRDDGSGGWIVSGGRPDALLAVSTFDAAGTIGPPLLSPVGDVQLASTQVRSTTASVLYRIPKDPSADVIDPNRLLLLADGSWRELDAKVSGVADAVATGDGTGVVMVLPTGAVHPLVP